MGLFSVGCDNISDKSFDKGLKKIQKMFPADKVLEKQLKFAFNHQSIKSAFWWYEHLPVKPNTGSDDDTLLLHRKFYNSLKRDSYNERFVATQEDITKFLNLVLPDNFNYADAGLDELTNKKDYIREMLRVYENVKNTSRFITPFVILHYWLIYHDGKKLDLNDMKVGWQNWKNNLDGTRRKEYTCFNDRIGWDLFKDL